MEVNERYSPVVGGTHFHATAKGFTFIFKPVKILARASSYEDGENPRTTAVVILAHHPLSREGTPIYVYSRETVSLSGQASHICDVYYDYQLQKLIDELPNKNFGEPLLKELNLYFCKQVQEFEIRHNYRGSHNCSYCSEKLTERSDNDEVQG